MPNFTADWFQSRWAEARNRAGKRYTKELDVPLPIAGYFESAIQEPPLFQRFQHSAAALEKARRRITQLPPPTLSALELAHLLAKVDSVTQSMRNLSDLRAQAPSKLPLQDSLIDVVPTLELLRDPLMALRTRASETREQSGGSELEGQLDAAERLHRLLRTVTEDIDTPVMSVTNTPYILLLGGAGAGKTHLLCEMTRQRVDRGAPAILFLGQTFQKPFTDAAQTLTDSVVPGVVASDFFTALDSYARQRSVRCLLSIDAINEGHRGSWTQQLPTLIQYLRRYNAIALVTSCRTPFEKLMVPDPGQLPLQVVAHHGFPPHIQSQAVETYFKGYGIPLPEVPLLEEEFSNPLFLKLFCEAIEKITVKAKHAQLRSLTSGQRGMTYVLEYFAKQKDRAISARLGTTPGLCWNLLKHAFASEFASRHVSSIPHTDAVAIANSVQPLGMPSGAVLQELVNEDLLAEDVSFSGSATPEVVIRFTYQKFADHLVARHLLASQLDKSSKKAIRDSLADPQRLGSYFRDQDAVLDQINIVEALMVEFPTRIDNSGELLDFLGWDSLPIRLCEALLNGLYWRDPRSINPSTTRWVSHFLRHEALREQTLNVLIALAVKPNHPLNASRLDAFLSRSTLVERDLSWSEYLRESMASGGTPERLLLWAEHSSTTAPSRDFTRAYIRLFKWFLTSTQRGLRDRVTRAIFRLGLSHPDLLFEETIGSLAVNDPYVPERMLAASYGVTMALWRSSAKPRFQAETLPRYAKEVFKCMFARGAKHSTTHILAREYAHRSIELAARIHRRLLSKSQLLLATPPFLIGGIRRWKERDDRDKGKYRNGDAPLGMDFANYTLGGLVSKRSPYQEMPEYTRVKRQILWRIYNLGYQLDKFSRVDQEIARRSFYEEQRGRGAGKTDRYGKKYAWIAFYELAGYRQDRGLLDRAYPRLPDADIDPSFPQAPNSTRLFPSWIDGALPVADWIRGGHRPPIKADLILAHSQGAAGPWVVLHGLVTQCTPDKSIFAFFSGMFVRKKDRAAAERILAGIECPGNHAVPRPEDEYYTYAGEIPWADTWRQRVYPATVGFGGEQITVLIPVRALAWESHHSQENQLGNVSFPSKELAEALKLYIQIPAISMAEAESHRVATLPVVWGDLYRNGESVLLLRQDLLEEYLRRSGLEFVVLVWGERRANIHDLEDWQTVQGQFELKEILHKQGFTYESGAFRQFC